MSKSLRALIVEDSEDDALLLLRELKRSGYDVIYERVQTADDLNAALDQKEWDVILSDYSMPGFDAPEALNIVQKQNKDIPFIIISGTVGEDAAVSAMKAGAADFFLKNRMTRLAPAIERELREAEERRRRHWAERQLSEAEDRFAKTFNASPIGIVIATLDEGIVIDANSSFLTLIGAKHGTVVGSTTPDLGLWDSPEARLSMLQKIEDAGAIKNLEISFLQNSGERRYGLVSIERIDLGDQPCTLMMIQDFTELKRAEQELRLSEERYRVISESISDYAFSIEIASDGSQALSWITDSFTRVTGFPTDREHKGAEFRNQDLYHPDDRERSKADITRVLAGEKGAGEYRIVTKDGEIRWISLTRYPEWDEVEERVTRFYGVAQDITERKQAEERLAEERNLLRTLIDQAPDYIFIKDIHGRFVASNIAHAAAAGLTPEDVIGKTASEAFDSELADQFHADDMKVIQSGKPLINEERITTSGGGDRRIVLTTKVPLRNPANEVIGLIGLSRDITGLKETEAALRKYTERLEILHKIDQSILSAQSPETIAQAVLDHLPRLVAHSGATVTTYDLQQFTFTYIASAGTGKLMVDQINRQHPIPRMEVIDVLKQGEIVEIDDLGDNSEPTDVEQSAIETGIRSYAFVPLIAGDRLLGAINLGFETPTQLSPEATEIIREVAAQLAIAIDNSRLLETVKKRNVELTALQQASVQLTSSLDLQTILNVIIDYGMFLVEASNAHIFLYDGETLTFGTAQWDGVRQSKPMFEPRPKGLTYQVAKSGEELVISDSTQHPLYAGWDTNSMGAIIGLPLRIGVRVNGVMSFAFTEPHIFEESEIRVLELLADQAATAINNGQLYERIQSHADELEQRVLERTEELEQEKDRVETILRESSDAILLLNLDGYIDQVNPAFHSLFGYTFEEVSGWLIGELIQTEQRSRLSDSLQWVIANDQAQRIELVAHRKDGDSFDADIALSPIKMNGNQQIEIVCSVRDITARKKVEAELRQALEIEKELNELKTNFISMVSHEFRTPLSVIMSSSELLTHYLDRMNEEKRSNHLSRIKQQVIRLTNLVDDVLTISRAETTGLSFEPRLIDLKLLSESIVEEVLSGFDHGYTVEFAPPDSCSQCFIDENLFRHIFQNLVSNALKYSHPQGTVNINMDCNDEAVILVVRDYGIGIPEEHQKNLFQTFHRASNVGNIQGTGLGLSIVKRAVDKHGGTIDFESAENEGTTFNVILPNTRPLD